MNIIEFLDNCDFNNLTLKEKVSKTSILLDTPGLEWDGTREEFLKKFPSCVEILECLNQNGFDPDKKYSYLFSKRRNERLDSIVDNES
jgi:hypothetical protein